MKNTLEVKSPSFQAWCLILERHRLQPSS